MYSHFFLQHSLTPQLCFVQFFLSLPNVYLTFSSPMSHGDFTLAVPAVQVTRKLPEVVLSKRPAAAGLRNALLRRIWAWVQGWGLKATHKVLTVFFSKRWKSHTLCIILTTGFYQKSGLPLLFKSVWLTAWHAWTNYNYQENLITRKCMLYSDIKMYLRTRSPDKFRLGQSTASASENTLPHRHTITQICHTGTK